MKPKVIKNFADKFEVGILNWWAIDNYRKNPHQYFDAGMDDEHPRSRFTTRLKPQQDYNDFDVDIKYPETAYTIQERILWRLKLILSLEKQIVVVLQ